jgi:hypothetical protein
MSTLARRPRTVNPARPQTSMLLSINGVPYQVQRLDADKVLALVAYRLTKPNGELHDVALTPTYGPECSCASWVFDHANLDGRCKHIVALQDWGLLPKASGTTRRVAADLAAAKVNGPTAGELEELLAGAPPTLPPTHEEICQMADLLMAKETLRSVPCHVCNGKRVDAFGGDCVGCGAIGVVPVP